MVNAAQDVFDTEQEIGSHHFKAARLGRNCKRWIARGQAVGLTNTIGELEPDQYVRRCLFQPADPDDAPFKATRTSCGPACDVGAAVPGWFRRVPGLTSLR